MINFFRQKQRACSRNNEERTAPLLARYVALYREVSSLQRAVNENAGIPPMCYIKFLEKFSDISSEQAELYSDFPLSRYFEPFQELIQGPIMELSNLLDYNHPCWQARRGGLAA